MKRITRKGFRGWLDEKPGNERVGFCNNRFSCPVANYLGAASTVGIQVYRREYGGEERELPAWARKFLDKIDARGISAPITARQALDVLDGEEQTG